jgi:coenzyme Q-binding protein COQ10
MADVSSEAIFEVPIEKVYQVITDYRSYPEFVDGASGVKIISESENGAVVEYNLNLIKKFTYRLQMVHQKPHKVSWTFQSGDLFAKNNGHWELTDLGNGRTQAKYRLEIDFKIMVPKMILNGLVNKNLPAMMEQYHKRMKKNL